MPNTFNSFGNSRFGQFADPNFGRSLYSRQNSMSPVQDDPMSQGISYDFGSQPDPVTQEAAGPSTSPMAGIDGGGGTVSKTQFFDEGGPVDGMGMIPEEDEEPAEDPVEEATQQVSKIMKALSFGRQQHGLPTTFFGGTDSVSFAEGGPVEGEGVIDEGGQQTPQMAMAYLTGEGALDPAQVQRVEGQFANMPPTQRKHMALESAPDEKSAFGLLQHYRKRFNAYSAFAQAAASGTPDGKPPNLASAAKAATQAFENIPDGNEVQFRPTEGGMEISFRPFIPSRPAPSGGEKPVGQDMAGNIPMIPAPSGGEKPPPFDMAYGPTSRPMIPTAPAPSGGERPPQQAGVLPEEDDTLYAAEGGAIPGEEDEEIVTGSTDGQEIPMSPAGQEETARLDNHWGGNGLIGQYARGQIAEREAAEFPRGDGQMPLPRPRGMRPGDGVAQALGSEQDWQQHGEAIRKFILNPTQFIQFLRKDGQMDSVVEQGMDKAIAAAMQGSADWAENPDQQRAASTAFQPGQAGGEPAPEQNVGQEASSVSGRLFKPEAARHLPGYPGMSFDDGNGPVDPEDAKVMADYKTRQAQIEQGRKQRDPDQLQDRAWKMFPSGGPEMNAWIEQQRQRYRDHQNKLELEHVKGRYAGERTQISADQRLQSSQLRSDAQRYAADQRIVGIGMNGEFAQRRVELAYQMKGAIEAMRQSNMNERQQTVNIQRLLSTAMTNSPGLIRDPEDQKSFLDGVMAQVPRPQTTGLPGQQPPAQQPPGAPQQPQQAQQGQQPQKAPREAGQRQPNTVYETPKGPLRWTGTGWVQP